jgi:hypothetical protein
MKQKTLPLIMLLAALSLAATAAYYSVYGISKLFTSQATAVIIMASILEASKLITATYLERFWNTIHWIRKIYLLAAMIILMGITSLGIYGFLVSAYQDTAYKMQSLDKVVEVEQTKQLRFKEQSSRVASEREMLNTNINELTKGLSNNIITYTDRNGNVSTTTSGATRKALEAQLENSTTRLTQLIDRESTLNDSIAAIDMRILDLQTNSDITAEIGPLRYIASISGKSVDQVVNWFILLFIVVFDPLAIILLISANKLLGKGDDEESKAERVKAPTPSPDPISNPQPEGVGTNPIADTRRGSRAVGSKWWDK